ncbi:MAG TPA: D-alanyl-D-alanine carboxypeptidase [Rhodopila sp.]|jgi:D-alanyl-D-alanine carboxypeptidase|nr:D-alanyl-D-alanine carboxypeptidase [Rhodopila sp.]
MASLAWLVRNPVKRRRAVAAGPTSKLLLTVVVATLAWSATARAQVGSARYSSIVIDESNGNVLEEVNADQPRHPASLTKMMTLYMTFEALRDHRIALDTLVPVSPHAASMEPTKLGVVPGSRLTVEQAILGLVTKSANDAASALGELLGGSEDRFAQMMTLRARALGMSHSTFTNASGLPDPDQWTTARDLAILSRHLIADFPNDYHYFSTPSFAWHRQIIPNHDTMLRIYPGADGLKTGYTDASGHNLATSALRGGVRLVGVVMGAGSNGERDIHMAALLDRGFEQMDVPVVRRPMLVASRISLMSSAHAAEVPRVTAHMASARMAEVTRVSARVAEGTHPAPHGHGAHWAVQVGTYPSEASAHSAAMQAQRDADAGAVRIEPVKSHGHTIWRAQVTGLTHEDAHDACAGQRKAKCLMIRASVRQVASR